MNDTHLIKVENLEVQFRISKNKIVRAVDGISFQLQTGKTLALVGESGCGKTTVGRSLLGLTPIHSGNIEFLHHKLETTNPRGWKKVRSKMSMIFQDPYASLDPRWKISSSIAEPLIIHGLFKKRDALAKTAELLELTGLDGDSGRRYPHELSGGQRQRAAIARALAINPALVIADEPTAALDISIRAQILNLLKDLQEKIGIAYLFISHDLSTVRCMADDVAVMYCGKIVEYAPSEAIFTKPAHPYTQALIKSSPQPHATGKLPPTLKGETPDLLTLPSGCRFRTRCPYSQPICAEQEPPLIPVLPLQIAACHFAPIIFEENF